MRVMPGQRTMVEAQEARSCPRSATLAASVVDMSTEAAEPSNARMSWMLVPATDITMPLLVGLERP